MTETRSITLTQASSIKSTRQRMLTSLIPLGTLCVLAGRGGEGKSTWALDLIADVNAGRADGDLLGEPADALIAALEDDWATVMKPRLQAAHADLDRVWRLTVSSTIDDVTRETALALPLDTDRMRSVIEQTGARIVLLDPATSLMAGDLNKREDVRRSLDGLLSVAQETACTVMLVVHFSKGTGNVSEKISGSHALRDAARTVLLFATDEETGQRVVSLDKANYSAVQTGSFAFNLVDTAIATDDGDETHVARVQHLGDSEVSVHDIVNRADLDADDRSAAEAFIVDFLSDKDACEAPARDVLKAGRGAGFSDTELKNARARCKRPKIRSQKSGFGAGWVWVLDPPEDITKVSKVSKIPGPDTYDTFDTFAPDGDTFDALKAVS